MEVRTESKLSSDVKFHGHNCLQNYTHVDMSHKFFANPNSTVIKLHESYTPAKILAIRYYYTNNYMFAQTYPFFLWLAI